MLRYPRLGVTNGMRGFFAVKYDEDGPINTGLTGFKESTGAWNEAREWAAAEGLECDKEPGFVSIDARSKKKAPVILKALDDTKGAGACRSCHAKIWWFELVSGKKHPFDAQPDGTPPAFLQTELNEDRRLLGHIDAAVSHFATCPQSKAWKRS